MFNKAIFTLVLVVSLLASSVHAADYAFALSPFQHPEAAKDQVTSVLKFSTALEPGDSVMVFDGYTLALLGTFDVPASAAYNSPKARLAVNGGLVKTLMGFAAAAHSPSGDAEPSHRGAVRLPQLLRTIAANRSGGARLDVIVLGSALYDDPKEPAFAMTEGRYPSDGHLSHHRGETVFGAAGNPALLSNLRVHISYNSRSSFDSESHQYFAERFWTLFVAAQGGELISFAPELSTVLARIRNQAEAPVHSFTRSDTDKLEMIRVRQIEIRQSIYERTLSTTPLTVAQVQRAAHTEVGLSWDCTACDLDVYARAHPGADVIFFGNTETALGTLWKDHLTSPRASKGFETIAFSQPLDLRALQLAVNFYGGEAPHGVRGELRIAVDGQTYAHDFRIAATNGNAGADIQGILASNQQTGTHTLLLDPMAIVSAR